MSNRILCWSVLGALGMMESAALGGARPAVMSVVVAEKNGVPIEVLIETGKEWVINPEAMSVQAEPGDIVKLQAWARCWTNVSGQALHGYLATFRYEEYFIEGEDPSNNVLPKDFKSITDPTNNCPLTPAPTGPNPNALINIVHPLWVFDIGDPTIPDTSRCVYRLGAATSGPGRFGVCPNQRPRYLATLILEVSADASGTFTICLDETDLNKEPCGPDNSFLSLGIGERVCDIDFECATIIVGGGCTTDEDCIDGLFCTEGESCDTGSSTCVAGTNPCTDGLVCDEDLNQCVEPCTTDEFCDDGEFCTGVETCDTESGLCLAGTDPCTGGLVCDEELGQCVVPPGDAELIGSTPADQERLTHAANNVVFLEFDEDIAAPGSGQVLVREIQGGCTLGADLSSSFTMTVENNGGGQPRVLKLLENGPVLVHRTWYSISNEGGWDGVADFEVQLLLQIGDANNDGTVTFADLARINGDCCGPADPADDRARSDINGDGNVTFADMSVANGRIPSAGVANPCGGP